MKIVYFVLFVVMFAMKIGQNAFGYVGKSVPMEKDAKHLTGPLWHRTALPI